MLYTFLFVITAILIMLYLQMRFAVKFFTEDRKKDYLAFNEQAVNQALKVLEDAVVALQESLKNWNTKREEFKEKYGEKMTSKNLIGLEVDVKYYWEAEFEKEERLARYQAMVEANISVRTGHKTIKEAESDFEKNFESTAVERMNKVEERWKEFIGEKK